jgi:16S rRNA (guanine966-N2)-methyltransferase
MRIISGKYKGRRISPPKNLPVRPTTDMSKESLFNILNNSYSFADIKVLDLFAGTGNLSYEFGSRGTEDITSVDEDAGCIRFIKQTADEMDFGISAIRQNVYSFLEKDRSVYDVIVADPPYHFEQAKLERLVDLIFTRGLLHAEGVLVIEHSKHTKLSHLKYYAYQKNYGGSIFSFFEPEEAAEKKPEEES